MDLNKAIKSRCSIRGFKEKKPNWKEIIECIDATRYAPTAGNNCTLKVILIDNKEKIEKISQACQQDFISQANYVVVFYSNKLRLTNAFGKDGEKYNKQQIGAAIENFLLKIQEKGLATCWIGYFIENQIKRELKIPTKFEIEALFPIGYEKTKSRTRRVKTDLKNILYFNKHGEKRMKPLRRID